ncbi:MAG: Fur family transcriptional regulator [Verrucomicrobiota bacterium]|nr:Fur family transcriptional regulator [Verrucomicrobiota bacterium]
MATTFIQPKSEDRETYRTTFKEYLTNKSLRVTSQRMAIFDASFNYTDHFTAEGLLDAARAIDRSVSRATVYRTLPILTESGLVREIDVGRDYKFYLANHGQRSQQAQVVCKDCERIFEIEAPFMEWYANSVAQKVGLEPESFRLQVHATCQRLKETGKCEHKSSRTA